MTVLTAQFSREVNQNPKERKDYLLKVVQTKDGQEDTVESVVDYTKIQESNGSIDMWDYATLRKANVDLTKTTPKTNNNTRIEGYQKTVDAANEAMEKIEESTKK